MLGEKSVLNEIYNYNFKKSFYFRQSNNAKWSKVLTKCHFQKTGESVGSISWSIKRNWILSIGHGYNR